MELVKLVNTTLSEVETADIRSRAAVEATRTNSQREAATAIVRTFVTLGSLGTLLFSSLFTFVFKRCELLT